MRRIESSTGSETLASVAMAGGGHGDPSPIHHTKVTMGLDGGQIEWIQGPPTDAMEWSGASLPFLHPGRRSRSSSSPRTSTSSSSKSKVWWRKMMVGAGIAVQEDGSLVTLGATVLTEVRGNVLVTPAAGGGMLNSMFLGVRSAPACSRSVFPVGKLSPCATRWTSMSRAGPS